MRHADKGMWVSQKAPCGFDMVAEVTTEVEMTILVVCKQWPNRTQSSVSQELHHTMVPKPKFGATCDISLPMSFFF